jgi:hypothetical protein
MTNKDVLRLRIQGATGEELKELTLMLLIEASERKLLPEINRLRILVHELQYSACVCSPSYSAQVKEELQELVGRVYVQ